jgi:signal peptidase I
MDPMRDDSTAAWASGSDAAGAPVATNSDVAPPDSPAPSGLTVRSRPPESHGVPRVARELFDWLKTLASAAVYATLIVTFVGQVARVEGSSMLPTLHDQDRLIVNKLDYRWHAPQIGDIVMVASPDEPDKMLVKRVVAGPGDVVRSVDGHIYRNDVRIPDDFVPNAYRSDDTWGPETIPAGHYFVMGDHRNDSMDSRAFGPVPERYILGKVQLRWWPIPDARIF